MALLENKFIRKRSYFRSSFSIARRKTKFSSKDADLVKGQLKVLHQKWWILVTSLYNHPSNNKWMTRCTANLFRGQQKVKWVSIFFAQQMSLLLMPLPELWQAWGSVCYVWYLRLYRKCWVHSEADEDADLFYASRQVSLATYKHNCLAISRYAVRSSACRSPDKRTTPTIGGPCIALNLAWILARTRSATYTNK